MPDWLSPELEEEMQPEVQQARQLREAIFQAIRDFNAPQGLSGEIAAFALQEAYTAYLATAAQIHRARRLTSDQEYARIIATALTESLLEKLARNRESR